MSHEIPKLFNGGGGGGFLDFLGGFGVRDFEFGGGGFSVNELLERTRPAPRRSAPPPPPVRVSAPPPPPPLPPPPPAPSIEPVGLLNDIINTVVGGGFTGGQVDINAQPSSGISNVLNDIILGQTTSRQEREVLGTPRAGDLFKAVTRVGGIPAVFDPIMQGLPTFGGIGGIPQIRQLAEANIDRGMIGFTGAPAMPPLSLVQPGVCPPGAQSYPAGTCLLDFQWEDAGGPRGFEIIGRNQDGRAILKKRGRRRRRRGLTKTQMGQVSWACNLPPNCRKEVLHGIVHG